MPVSEKLEDLTKRAGGKSPLRLIVKRTWHDSDSFTDTLICGHESGLHFTDFGYVRDKYIHRIPPTAKRRRCQTCKASAVCAVPIPMQLPAQNPDARPAFNLYVTALAEIALPPKKPSQSERPQDESYNAAHPHAKSA
jgi:hypothetical protein